MAEETGVPKGEKENVSMSEATPEEREKWKADFATSQAKVKAKGEGSHGLPMREATPELRRQWKADLEASGKYTPGASLKDLIANREGLKSGAED